MYKIEQTFEGLKADTLRYISSKIHLEITEMVQVRIYDELFEFTRSTALNDRANFIC